MTREDLIILKSAALTLKRHLPKEYWKMINKAISAADRLLEKESAWER